jgi:hypothetical protein
MPGTGPISWAIMKKYHLSTMHGGSNHALLASREKYWFLRGGKLAISVRKKCSNCIPYDRKPISVPEATLPKERITPCYPFEVTGLDFAGPIGQIGSTPKEQEKKYYVLIFTCAVTRLVSFELTSAVDKEHFVMGFDTFRSQKGKPKIVYSDNAQTFRSVEKQITLPMSDWDQVVSGYTDIQWKFNVTRAAWWGGFFERVVRMLKEKLKRSFSKQKWASELHAISALKTIEAAVNSRPLGHVSMEMEDGRPICPIDFLHYRAPYPLKDEIHEKLVNTMNLTQLENLQRKHISKVRSVWKVLQQGYLQTLRKYHFQREDTTDQLQPGQIVLVMIPGQPRVHWPKGRVVSLIHGRDISKTGKPCIRAALVRNYNPAGVDRKLKKEILSRKKRQQLTPAERLWISGANSDNPIRYPVQLLIPLEMHGITGTEADLDTPGKEFYK